MRKLKSYKNTLGDKVSVRGGIWKLSESIVRDTKGVHLIKENFINEIYFEVKDSNL